MKVFAALLLLLLLSGPLASAQIAITYKCWVTLHGGAEREYTVPGSVSSGATFPVEIPDYGRAICHIQTVDALEKTNDRGALPPSVNVSLATVQQLESAGGNYSSLVILDNSFAQSYSKRIAVLDTPAYSFSVELLKN